MALIVTHLIVFGILLSLPSPLPPFYLSSSFPLMMLTIFLCSYGGQGDPVSDLKQLLFMEVGPLT